MKSIDIIIFLYMSIMMLLMAVCAVADYHFYWAIAFIGLSVLCLLIAVMTAERTRS